MLIPHLLVVFWRMTSKPSLADTLAKQIASRSSQVAIVVFACIFALLHQPQSRKVHCLNTVNGILVSTDHENRAWKTGLD
jgi:hypothetical protein